MGRMPVLDGIMKYIGENVTPFHMPGHKNNKRDFEELELIRENLYRIDNTEVPGLDNLHAPEEIILSGQRLAARAYGAGESFFLVNGSTCGIYSMILGLTKPGDKIIVQRNCHRSVFMACFMGDLNPVYIRPRVIERFNIAAGIDVDEIIELMELNRDARAIVLTYPTYYGTCSDLERITLEAHKRGMLVLVDEAHGAHLPFNKRLPKSAMECGADASVVSLHKSTPALTQASLLNLREGLLSEGIKFMLRLYQSTSPSYVLMASIDASRHIMEERGETLLNELLDNIEGFRRDLEGLGFYTLLNKAYIGDAGVKDIDLTKIVINSPIGGKILEDILRRDYGIQVEMSDVNNITLITSIGDTKYDFEKLYLSLYDIKKKHIGEEKRNLKMFIPQYKTAMNMKEAYYREKEKIELRVAEGRISAEMVSPYPPGIPILLPGEIITSDIIEYIIASVEYGISLNGITDASAKFIEVVKA